jgi:hypothetical protein
MPNTKKSRAKKLSRPVADASCTLARTVERPITISNYQRFLWIRDQLAKEGVNLHLSTGN